MSKAARPGYPISIAPAIRAGDKYPMNSSSRPMRMLVLLAGLGVLVVLIAAVPTLRGAIDRNVSSHEALRLVQGIDWTKPEQVCLPATPPFLNPVDCVGQSLCYVTRVSAVRAGYWQVAQASGSQTDDLTVFMQGWSAWCSDGQDAALTLWKRAAKPIGHKFLMQAQQALVRHEAEAALRNAKIVHELAPSAQTFFLLGSAYDQSGDTQRALDAYLAALASESPTSEMYFQTGELEWRSGENERARVHFARAIELDSSNWNYWHLYGSAFLNLHDWKNAEDAFWRATELNPTFGHSYAGLSFALLQQEKFAQAQDSMQNTLRFISDQHQQAGYLAEFGKILSLHGQMAQAQVLYTQAVELTPENGGFWGALVGLYTMQNDCAGLSRAYADYTARRARLGLAATEIPMCTAKPPVSQ